MGGMFSIINTLVLGVYIALVVLVIYGLILLIKTLRRAIVALNYYNAEMKAKEEAKNPVAQIEAMESDALDTQDENDVEIEETKVDTTDLDDSEK